MSDYHGDYKRGAVVRIPFNANAADGSVAGLTSGALVVSSGGAVVAPSGGVSIAATSAGVYEAVVDTSVDPSAFVRGDYAVRLSAGTVGGVSVAGHWLGSFSLENRSVPPQSGDAFALVDGRLTEERAGRLDAIAGLATADQIPADFTAATFDGPGVFAAGALANAPAGGGGPARLDDEERAAIAAAVLDLVDGVESGETVRQTLRLLRAVLAGRAVAGDGVVEFLRKDGTTVALTVTHDAAGNRTSSAAGAL